MATDPVNFDEQSARRIVRAVRRIEKVMPTDRGRTGAAIPGDTGGFWAELTSVYYDVSGEHGYRWKLVNPDQGTAYAFADEAGGFTGKRAIEPNGDKALQPGHRVYLELAGYDSGKPWYLITSRPGGIFKVKLVEDTSPTPLTQSGDKDNLPVFQYTVQTEDGAFDLAVQQTPHKPYMIKCVHYPVGYGYAHYDKTHTLVLDEDWYTFYQHNCA